MQAVKRAKTIHDVRGYQVNCINFQKCPLCYGCRRYSSIDPECQICLLNKKQNICNKDLHRDDLVSKMITKSVIMLDQSIAFASI